MSEQDEGKLDMLYRLDTLEEKATQIEHRVKSLAKKMNDTRTKTNILGEVMFPLSANVELTGTFNLGNYENRKLAIKVSNIKVKEIDKWTTILDSKLKDYEMKVRNQ